MPVIPEIIIQKAIIRGWTSLKQDPRIMDVLFKNFSQPLLEELKAFILNTPVDFSINYPRKQELHVPSIVLLLRNESESQTFLGDMMGISPAFGVPDQDVTIDTLDSPGGSTSTLRGLGLRIAGGIRVVSSQVSTVTIANSSLAEFQESVVPVVQSGKCHKLHVVSGTGSGQVKTIIAAASNSLDIDGTFDVQLDSTSVLDIREADETCLTEGAPSRVYNPDGVYQRLGVNYEVLYQLQIVAGHQDQVIYLYSIIKALLLSQRPFLEEQGVLAFKLSGSDFAPRSEYLPSEVFTRALNMQFTYPFSFLEEIDVAGQIEVCLTPETEEIGTGITLPIGTITL